MVRRRKLSIGPALALAGALCLVAAATPAADRTGDPATLTLEDAPVDRRSCELSPDRVFTPTRFGAQCVAYFATEAGAETGRAVIYFQGDYLRDQLDDTPKNRAAQAQTRERLEQLAARTGTRFIIIARPGTLGSSGVQVREKHHRRELEAMNRMIDTVKEKYAIATMALAGQSGGSYVLAGVLASGRADIACAAAGSGVYSLTDRWRSLGVSAETIRQRFDTQNPQNPWYSPKEEADGIARVPGRRIFVIGDQSDANARFADQMKYAERLERLGHHVQVLQAKGVGSKRHGLTHVALHVAAWCLSGVPDTVIARNAATLPLSAFSELDEK